MKKVGSKFASLNDPKILAPKQEQWQFTTEVQLEPDQEVSQPDYQPAAKVEDVFELSQPKYRSLQSYCKQMNKKSARLDERRNDIKTITEDDGERMIDADFQIMRLDKFLALEHDRAANERRSMQSLPPGIKVQAWQDYARVKSMCQNSVANS